MLLSEANGLILHRLCTQALDAGRQEISNYYKLVSISRERCQVAQ